MKEAIIEKYPGLKPENFDLQDNSDGNGIFISRWDFVKAQPAMSDVLKWHEEYMKTFVPPETVEQKAARLERENAELQERTQTLSKSIAELYEFIS